MDGKISLFPMDSMRLGQKDFYEDAKNAVENGKILLANAPTGIGKTAASLSAALESALPQERRVLFLTNRNSHHIQAMMEIRRMNANRAGEIGAFSGGQAAIRVVDKIAKEKMCLHKARNPHERSPYLRCEMNRAFCKYSRPTHLHAEYLLDGQFTAEESLRAGVANGYCAHFCALSAMRGADVIICDYRYLFDSDVREAVFRQMGCGLSAIDAIIDEAHNLPDAIRSINEHIIDADTIRLSAKALREAARAAGASSAQWLAEDADFLSAYLRTTLLPEINSWLDGTNEREESEIAGRPLKIFEAKAASLASIAKWSEQGGQESLSERLARVSGFLHMEIARKKEEHLTEADCVGLAELGETAAFLGFAEQCAAGNRAYGIFLKSSPDNERMFLLRASLHDPSVASRGVFESLHSAILMSGTLLGKRRILDLLGIGESRADGLGIEEYESSFEAGRHPIRICTAVSSRLTDRKNKDKMQNMAKIIELAASACAPHSIAIYYPSYEYMEMVRKHLDLGGMEAEGETRGDGHGRAEEKKLRIESSVKEGRRMAFHAVIGGAYSEGMDFRNNPFKLIVMAGFPIPKPTAMHGAYERYLSGKLSSMEKAWEYASLYPAIIRTVQAIGRGVRSQSDWCYSLLIDDRFAVNAHLFPPRIRMRASTISPRRIEEDMKKFISEMESGS